MSFHEGEPSSEVLITLDAVGSLKRALMYLAVSPLKWQSDGGTFEYTATPLELPGQEPVDPITLVDMPLYRYDQILNAWELERLHKADINGDVAFDHYLILAGHDLIHTSHVISLEDTEDETGQRLGQVLQESAELQDELGLSDAEPKDYDDLTLALTDLKAITEAAVQERRQKIANMTPDERRWARQQTFSWLVSPEMKIAGPRWWGITEGSVLWAVHASSPDEAIVMIEENRDWVPILPFFFIDEYPEDVQAQLENKLDDNKVVRLIPWSIEPWPEDRENMTAEQKEAFDRLKLD